MGILHVDKGIEMHNNMNIEICFRISLLKVLYTVPNLLNLIMCVDLHHKAASLCRLSQPALSLMRAVHTTVLQRGALNKSRGHALFFSFQCVANPYAA